MEQARLNMVEQQIRPWNVLDPGVLELLGRIKREQFVPPGKQAMAFMDMEVPLGYGASMWCPKVEARALQELHLKRTDYVLEVGTGSGYLTALLAQLAEHVTSVEIAPELNAFAEKNLAAHHVSNVTLLVGDAARGWSGSYDAIILTGSVPVLPEAFQNSLKPGGRLFAIVGEGAMMQAERITCISPGVFEKTDLFETSVPPLKNVLQPKRFVF